MNSTKISDAFKTERLFMRAVENNEEDRYFLHQSIENDPANAALFSRAVLRPKSTKHIDWLFEQMAKATLAVMICMPADGEAADDAAGQPKPKPALTPIGAMIIGWGGRVGDFVHNRSTAIGISLAEPYQDRGYGGEALNWALDWAFRFGGFHRVELGVLGHNERAQHLYKRLGFVEEGRSREALWFDRKWYDVINYSMLESEWEALRGLS